jgi:hypothetical protein
MRLPYAIAAAFLIALVAGSLEARAQQPTTPAAEPAKPSVAKTTKKRRVARAKHRHVRTAALRHRTHPCTIIDGWRAFPVRYRDSYFDTSRVCRTY